MVAAEKILTRILELAGVNPLAAVVLLFLLLLFFVAGLAYLFLKDKRQRKSKEGKFIYASGLINNLGIRIDARFDKVEQLILRVEEDLEKRVVDIEKDVGIIKALAERRS